MIARSNSLLTTLLAVAAVLSLTACDQFADAVDENKNKLDVPVQTSYTFSTSFDIGAIMGSAAGQKAPQKIEKDLSLPATSIDLVKQVPALANAKGRVKSFEITKIDAHPKVNSVTGALPSFDLHVGAHSNTDLAQTAKIATIPSIPSKSTAVVAAVLHKDGMAAAQPHFTALAFSQMIVAKMVVNKGETVPGGKADLDITLAIKAVLNPIK